MCSKETLNKIFFNFRGGILGDVLEVIMNLGIHLNKISNVEWLTVDVQCNGHQIDIIKTRECCLMLRRFIPKTSKSFLKTI